MLINKNSLSVDGIQMAQYLTEVEYGYNKVWGKDSGRNLAASQSGTLLGIVPKLKFNFRRLTQTELEYLAPHLDSAVQNTTYYDPKLKRLYTMKTYTGDWATTNKNTFTNLAKANEPFSISFIAKDVRSNV